MRFVFQVEVEMERTEGKFATREEISNEIVEALEGADIQSFTGENDGQYEVTEWAVADISG
jgi:hypothetical protein